MRLNFGGREMEGKERKGEKRNQVEQCVSDDKTARDDGSDSALQFKLYG